ncbi:MAG TPA: protoheme IX farnesyltransferase, partial [Dehalococcoidia bacterium]|nr:protoheme IX farnesyltransferase [Dehalococcoidia bacterium]
VPAAGWLYGAGAAALGVAFLVQAHRLRRRVGSGGRPDSMRLFHASIQYLALLFVLLAITALI